MIRSRFAVLASVLALMGGCPGDGGVNEGAGFPAAVTFRASLSSSGAQGNKNSGDVSQDRLGISADGRYVAFASDATNLVAGDTNNLRDIYVRDTVANVTVRASVLANGTAPNADCQNPAISGDGRFVAFDTTATNLLATTAGRTHVYLKDLETGTLVLISAITGGVLEGGVNPNDSARVPSVSFTGRFVAFESDMANLTGGALVSQHIFRRDTTTNTTLLVSQDSAETEGTGGSARDASISESGARVAFQSGMTNLHVDDPDGSSDVFVRVINSDVTGEGDTLLASRATGVAGAKSQSSCDEPKISGDGTSVVFITDDAALIDPDDTNTNQDVFVRNLTNNTTVRASLNSKGGQTGKSTVLGGLLITGDAFFTAISRDGRFVAFGCWAGNLVSDDFNENFDVFLRDLQAGTTVRCSVRSLGVEGNDVSFCPAISADGRFVAFMSLATNLVENDTNGNGDIFVRGPSF